MRLADIQRAQRIVLLDDVLHVADFDGVLSMFQFQRIHGRSRDGATQWVIRVGDWLREFGVRFTTACDRRNTRTAWVEFDYRALFRFVQERIADALAILERWEPRSRRSLRRIKKRSRRLSEA